MGKNRDMLLEMHAHTQEHSSCSHVAAADLVRRVFAKGLQGIVFTDHHYLWPEEELKVLRRKVGIPDHFLLLAGQEVDTPEFGDVLIFGATESLERGTSLAEIRGRFPETALVWAHPYRKGRMPSQENLLHPLLDAIEIFNSNHSVRENGRGLRDWHRHRFTATAGTDTHGESYAGLYPTQFDHPAETMEGLVTEIRSGRCRPFFKEIPKAGSSSRVTEVTIGTKGLDEIRERIVIQTLESPYKWRSAERAHHIMAAISRRGFDGGPFRVPRPIDADRQSMTLIQQGLRGKSLFDKLLVAPPDDGRDYLELAARWLARLHNCRLRLTPISEFRVWEKRRLARYVERFAETGHKHRGRAQELMEAIQMEERKLVGKGGLVQGHGDFHPKNLIIGQDREEDRATRFIAAIDFESSLCLPPAFDVGTFLAQFRNQFFAHPEVLSRYSEELFLEGYLNAAEEPGENFHRLVELFRARTNLGIAAYLIKLGLGDSGNLWRVLVEAERAVLSATGACRPRPGK
jgi:hypothetical protein